MRRELPGAWYCDALPGGAFVALYPDSHLETHYGRVPLPPGGNLLYVRLAPDGIRLAGQGHQDGRAWEWTGTAWVDRGPAYGVSPVIYDHDGKLLINDGSWGSQGARFIDWYGDVVTGDASYFAPEMELSEYSAIDYALCVGQAHPDGVLAAWIWDNGTHRLLESGDCRFIRANRDGDRVSIALWKPGVGAVSHWLTLAEIHALPVVTRPSPQPQPAPTPTPEPPKPMPVPNQLSTVRTVRAGYPTPLGAQHAAFLIAVARATSAKLLRKEAGTNVLLPSGVRVSQDILMFGDQGVDILSDGEGAAEPAWIEKGTIAGEYIDVGGGQTPGPTTPQPIPAGSVGGALDREFAALRADLAAALKRIAALEARPSGSQPSPAPSIHGTRIALKSTTRDRYLSDWDSAIPSFNRPEAQGGETYIIEVK